jgi:hypothetical protein
VNVLQLLQYEYIFQLVLFSLSTLSNCTIWHTIVKYIMNSGLTRGGVRIQYFGMSDDYRRVTEIIYVRVASRDRMRSRAAF